MKSTLKVNYNPSQQWTMAFLLCFNLILFQARAQTVPGLVNYQGRLTDAAAVPLPAGSYAVAFRLWDSPTLLGQTLIWGREYDVTIVENGAFNVILGGGGGRTLTDSPPPAVNELSFAFGESNRFLGLTVTRGTNGQAVPNAMELVPRQQILSAPFAFRANTVSPEGVNSNAIQSHAVTFSKLGPESVGTTTLQNGSVTLEKLGVRPVGTNVPAGGLAMSASSGNFSTGSDSIDVTNLTVTIVTTGRPVYIGLIGDGSTNDCYIGTGRPNAVTTSSRFAFTRNSNVIFQQNSYVNVAGSVGITIRIPPAALTHIDHPPAGTNTYKLRVF